MHIDIDNLPVDYVTLSNAFPSDFDPTYHIPTDVGQSIVNGIWTIAYTLDDKDINTIKDDLKANVAAIRYQKEISGIQFESNNIGTDRGSQAMILGAYTASTTWVDGKTLKFKTSEGWVTYTKTQINDLAVALSDHVQNCFTAESIVSDSIGAAVNVTDLRDIDLNSDFITALI